MIKRLLAGALALCALAISTVALAQSGPLVTAPAGSMVPSTAVTFGPQNSAATFVDRTHVLPAGRPDIAATGTIAAGTPNAAYTVAIDGNGVAAFKLAGLTASGATLTLEGSYDGGTTWAAINGVSGGTGILATTYAADGNFTAATGGRTGVRLRVSSTGSGTITVASNLSGVSTDIRMSSPLPPGSNTIGSIGNTSFAISGTLPAFASPPTVSDPSNAAFQGAIAMTVGTTYTAARSVGANCTVAGNMAVTMADASILTVPVSVGFQTFPFAATAVNSSGTTATCTYVNLK